MEQFVLPILLACIGSAGLSNLIQALLQRKWKKADEAEAATKNEVTQEQHKAVLDQIDGMVAQIKALINAQKITMLERTRYIGTCYIAAKQISIDDKEIITKMHSAYKGLGGNGDLDAIMHEIDRLEVVVDDHDGR